MAQTIYFDEAGFTGNHLLDIEQRFFAYASVATDDDEAKDFVESLIRRYNIQGGELKGGSLVRFNKGRKAIDEIIKEFDGRLLFTITEKKYTLACKFFEYIFEPCISQISTLFYGCDFHKFISTILYVEFMARGAGADQIFEEFQDLMRALSDSKLEALFSSSTHPENSPILTHIREFAQHRIEDIREELESLSGNANGKWVLDLTCTSLHGLLSEWGGKFDVITAICVSGQSRHIERTSDRSDSVHYEDRAHYVEQGRCPWPQEALLQPRTQSPSCPAVSPRQSVHCCGRNGQRHQRQHCAPLVERSQECRFVGASQGVHSRHA